MKRDLCMLLAVGALIASTLACAVGEPTLENVRSAKDEDGTQPASVFSPTETVYIVSDLSNGIKGNVISSKWYAVEVADTEPNLLLDEAEISIEDDAFTGTIYFYFPPPNGRWPAGLYQVEVYFNGTFTSSVQFTVQ